MGFTFDDLISQGKDIEAIRYFAKEYYDNGKMGHTRKLLIERVANENENLKYKVDVTSEILIQTKQENDNLKQQINALERQRMTQSNQNADMSNKIHILEIENNKLKESLKLFGELTFESKEG